MGQPGGRHCPPPPAEHIGWEEVTRGTETSKYPEEEKSTEIPQVVASERGGGQTEGRKFFGVRTCIRTIHLVERRGKADHRG